MLYRYLLIAKNKRYLDDLDGGHYGDISFQQHKVVSLHSCAWQDFKHVLKEKVSSEALLSTKGLDLKRFSIMRERLPPASLQRVRRTAELCGEGPTMAIFRDVRDLTESKIRASNVECLLERAQVAMTYRLMHELESRWKSSGSMTVAQAKLEKCGEWLHWREAARHFDKKLGSLKFADEEMELLMNCFAEGQLDAVLAPECTTPSKSWAPIQKIMWMRREKPCNSLRQQSNDDIEATKQKLLQMEKDQCSSEGGVSISWYFGVFVAEFLDVSSIRLQFVSLEFGKSYCFHFLFREL